MTGERTDDADVLLASTRRWRRGLQVGMGAAVVALMFRLVALGYVVMGTPITSS